MHTEGYNVAWEPVGVGLIINLNLDMTDRMVIINKINKFNV